MRRYRFSYFLGQSFKGLWRNGIMTVASITVLFSCLVVMGSFSLLIMNINTNLDNLGLLNEIVAFVDFYDDKEEEAKKVGLGEASDDSGASEEETTEDEASQDSEALEDTGELSQDDPDASLEDGEIKYMTREEEMARLEALKREIEALGNVSEVVLVTKEQALAEEREKYKENEGLYDLVENDNPLRDSFVIKYADNSAVSTLVYNLDTIKELNGNVKDRAELAQNIEDVKNTISLVLVSFIAILFVVSIFVIINTIKLALHSRRSEIVIMRYIGATDWFIMLPFVLEGIFIGIFSGGLAFGLQYFLYEKVCEEISKKVAFIKLLGFNEVAMIIAASFIGVGVLTGIIGSVISTRKYRNA